MIGQCPIDGRSGSAGCTRALAQAMRVLRVLVDDNAGETDRENGEPPLPRRV